MLHSRLVRKANPRSIFSLPEYQGGMSESPTDVEDFDRPSAPDKLPDRVIIQVCNEIYFRGTGSPIMFYYNQKYFVAFKSSCSNVPERIFKSIGSCTHAGHKNGSYSAGCSCAKQCRRFDDFMNGPNGKVWQQAVEKQTDAAQTLVVKNCSFMWFPIKTPINGR